MRLQALLRERIAAAHGWLPFADFMRVALYEPGLGYYSAGAAKFGAAGDFVTAPEISPLFSQCLAGQCAAMLEQLGGGDVLEPGAGSGVMAATMLTEFERRGTLPGRYLILETSAELRARQEATLAGLPAALRERVSWLEQLPGEPFRGVVVANEVADALPVTRFVVHGSRIDELGVETEGDTFRDARRPAGEALRSAVADFGLESAGEYRSELSAELPGWIAALGGCVSDGAILLLDYGFSRREYYLPERNSGTLRCYYRHRAHDNPYVWPGLQDITAWVDFTAVAEAGRSAGMRVAGYTSQAQFLLAGGIDELASQAFVAGAQAQAKLAHGLRQLMLPGEMGDAVKAIALTRGSVDAPPAFAGRDMRSSL